MATKEVIGQSVVKYSIDASGLAQGVNQISSHLAKLAKDEGVLIKGSAKFGDTSIRLGASMAKTTDESKKMGMSMGALNGQLLQATLTFSALAGSINYFNKQFVGFTYNFDRNMTLVRAVSGATQQEFEKLSDTALEMGSQMEFGAAKAAEALLTLSRMGLNAAESATVLGPAMQLAQSQQYGLAESATIVIQQLKTFNKSVFEAADVSNTLAAISAKSAADMEKLGQSLSYVGPVAAVAGRSFEEVNAALGLMYNAGIRASTAGTSLRFAFSRLMSDIPNVKKSVQAIGLSMDDIHPSFNSMNDILLKFADALRNTKDRASAMFKIFGPRAAPGMAILVEQVIRNRYAFENMQDAITGTNEAARQAEVQMQSFSGQALRLRAGIERLGIVFGKTIVPTMQMGMDVAEGLFQVFLKLPQPIKEIAGAMALTAGGGTAFLAMLTMGAYSARIFGSTLGMVSKAFQGIKVNIGSTLKPLQESAAIHRAFNKVMQEEVITNAISVRGIGQRNRALAEGVMQEAMARASKKALVAQKREVIIATIQEAHTHGILQKEQTKAMVSSVNSTLAMHGLTKAQLGAATSTGVLSGAFRKLGLTIKAVVTSSMFWLTALTIGIGILISAIAKWRAEEEKIKRVREENIDATKEFLKYHNQELAIRKEILAQSEKEKKDLDTLKQLREELNNVLDTSSKARNKLALAYPEIIDGYNKENGQLILNIELLKEKLKVEEVLAKKAKGQSDEIINRVDKWKKEADAATSVAEKLRILQGALDTLKFESKEIQIGMGISNKEIERLEKIKSASGTIGGGIAADVQYAIDSETKKREGLKQKLKEQAEAMIEISKEYNNLKNAGKDSGNATDMFADKIGDAGKKVTDYASKLDRLKDRLDKIKETMEKDIFNINATQLAKDLNDMGLKAKKFRSDMIKILNDIEKILNTTGVEDKIGSEKFNAMKDTLSETRKGLEASVKQWHDAMTGDLLEKTLEKRQEKLLDNAKEVSENENKIYEKMYGKNIELSVKSLKDKHKKESTIIKNNIKNTERMLVKARKDQNEVDISYLSEKLSQERELQRQHTESLNDEIARAKIEAIDEVFDYESQVADTTIQNELEKAKVIKDLHVNRVKAIEEAHVEGTAAHKKALLEMKKADENYVNELTNTWRDAMKLIGNSIVDLTDIFNDELSELFTSINKIADGIFNLIQGIAKENYLQAASGAIEAIIGVVEWVAREVKNDEEERKKREKEYQKHMKDIANTFSELNAEADLLKFGFIDLARNVVSLNKSIEDVLKDAAGRRVGFEESMSSLDPLGSARMSASRAFSSLQSGTFDTSSLPDDFQRFFSQPIDSLTDELYRVGRKLADPNAVGSTAYYKYFKDALGDNEQNLSADAVNFLKAIAKSSEEFARQKDPTGFADMLGLLRDEYFLTIAAKNTEGFRDVSDLLADGNITASEYLSKLEDIEKVLKQQAGKKVTLSTGEEIPLASGQDYVSIVKGILESKLEEAGRIGGEKGEQIARDAYKEFQERMSFAIGSFTDITTNTILSLMKDMRDIPKELKDFLEGLSQSVEAKINEMQTGIDTATGLVDFFNDYEAEIDSIKDKYEGIKEVWEGLLEDREELRQSFEEDKAKILSDSSDRIGALEEEREAVIGLFDFSETQNKRSQRFAKAREIEKKVIDEIAKASEKLTKLNEKFQDDLDKINEKIKEFEDEYISIANLQTIVNARTAEAYENMVRELNKMKIELEGILGYSIDILKAWREGDIAGLVNKTVSEISRNIESSGGTPNLSGASGASGASGGSFEGQPTLESFGIESFKDPKTNALIDYSKGKAESPNQWNSDVTAVDINNGNHNFPITSDPVEYVRRTGKRVEVVNWAGIPPATVIRRGNTEGSVSYDYPNSGDGKGNYNKTGNIDEAMWDAIPKTPQQAGYFEAQHGFHGIVRKPTNFTVGEFNKPEMVSITPLAKAVNGLAGSNNTNITIVENLDFRGAYGIQNKRMAEQVYRKVWAPARRNNLNRYFNQRGKVIR